jgi:DNA polymerase III alpha subunit (gram-positive type)
MNLLIVDIETTTADIETAAIIEIACCLWSVEHRCVLSAYSTLVQSETNPAEHVNGISPGVLSFGHASSADRAFASVGHFVAKTDVIAAHNGDGFDRPVLERHACPWTTTKPWLDTMDLDWPRASSSRALIQVAAAHHVPIGKVHRAMSDVMLVASLLERAAELGDIEAMIAKGLRPKATYEVAEKGFSEERNKKSKDAGFRFDAPTKTWRRRMAKDDASSLPFAVKEVGP